MILRVVLSVKSTNGIVLFALISQKRQILNYVVVAANERYIIRYSHFVTRLCLHLTRPIFHSVPVTSPSQSSCRKRGEDGEGGGGRGGNKGDKPEKTRGKVQLPMSRAAVIATAELNKKKRTDVRARRRRGMKGVVEGRGRAA